MNQLIFSDMEKLKKRFMNATCIVLGDIMLDTYLYGEVNRISPEGPIPIVNVKSKKMALGGAANVACNVKGYGIHTVLCGIIGNDIAGMQIKQELAERDIDFQGIESGTRKTTSKTRIVGKSQQMLRFDEEVNVLIAKEEEQQLLERLKTQMTQAEILIISDYDKGVCTNTLCKQAISLAKEKGVLVVTDPKEIKWDKYRGSDIITPNFKEFCEAIEERIPNESEKISIYGKKLVEKYQITSLLVTRSEHGMTLLENEEATTFDTLAQEVFDVSGAGDTVIASLAAFLAIGETRKTATEIANAAAGIAVSKAGTYVISLEEVADYNSCNRNLDTKILEIKFLQKQLAIWRKENKEIVFTNGCFDILHAGHVSYLKQAKQMGDILIIGLNTDRSVKTLKGENRPINNEIDRALLLSSLVMVDAVILFDEDTPYELIESIQPDVLVKGGDYKIEDIVGRQFAKEVRTIPFVEGHSSTNIINRM